MNSMFERFHFGMWAFLIASAMTMTWVYGFDTQRGSWAFLGCMLLLCIYMRLGEVLDAIQRGNLPPEDDGE